MNKTVLITGGAKGIGRAIAEVLSKKNLNVIVNYNTSEKEALDLKEKYSNIEIIKADVTKEDEIKRMLQGKNIDILISNAGINQIKMFQDITKEDWDNMMNTNLNSLFNVTREVLPNMLSKKEGCIINISSIWGVIGASCEVHYATSKARNDWIYKIISKRIRTF